MTNQSEDSCSGNASGERKSVRFLTLGNSGIGKTSLIKTYLDLDHELEEEVNIFELYRVRMKYNGREIDVEIFDIRDGTRAFERRRYYPKGVDVILLCFSIGKYESLKNVYNLWIHEVRAHFGKLIPIFLVGLGSDARLTTASIDAQIRPVEKHEGEEIHKKGHFHAEYMECSIYDRTSILNVIRKAFLAVMED